MRLKMTPARRRAGAGLCAAIVLFAGGELSAQATSTPRRAPAPSRGEVSGERARLERLIQRRVLPNGLEVIVVENHGVPLVTVEAVVKNGSFVQTPEFEGLAHLYEHMIFGANERYPEQGAFLSRLSELGADFNGQTREELVNYYLTLHSDSLEGAMQTLASALTTPLFLELELQRERDVVIGEYDRNEAQPFHYLQRAMDEALWGEGYVRKNPLGRRDVILDATPEQMRELQKRYYVPNNTALIIAGDVTPARGFELAERMFGSWPRAADPFVAHPVPALPPLAKDTALIVEQPIGAAVLMLQWHGPSAKEDVAATYAADVFSDALNQPDSKFQRRLVDSGLFQQVSVNYYTLNHVGPITVFGVTTPDKLREAKAALEGELAKVAQPGYITREELEPLKRQRVAGTLFGLERASGFAHQLGFWWAVTGFDYYLGYVDAMAAQTTEDLARYAQRYIVGKPHVRGVMLSPEARMQLQLTTQDLTSSETAP